MTTKITSTEKIIDGLPATVWTITEDGIAIGHLDAHASGLILNIEVDPARQGEGFARKLYEHADATHGLLHVPAWGRTWEGEQFAEAMGGDTMDDAQAAEILGLNLADMLPDFS